MRVFILTSLISRILGMSLFLRTDHISGIKLLWQIYFYVLCGKYLTYRPKYKVQPSSEHSTLAIWGSPYMPTPL